MREKGYDWCETHRRYKVGINTLIFCPDCEQDGQDIVDPQDPTDNVFWMFALRNVTGTIGRYNFTKTSAGEAVEGTLFVGNTQPVDFFIDAYTWSAMNRPTISGKFIVSDCYWNNAKGRLILRNLTIK